MNPKLRRTGMRQIYVILTIIVGTYLTYMRILLFILTLKVINLVDIYFILVII